MYRYEIDNTVTYSPEDILLFKESPFASWMERLTLESPNHGIAPDFDLAASCAETNSATPWHSADFSCQKKAKPLHWSEFTSEAYLPAGNSQNLMVETSQETNPDTEFVNARMEESSRRIATLNAMRDGVGLIVNAQLAVGPIAGRIGLLIRSNGLSELGSYLYLPCDTTTRNKSDLHLTLCFHADLLHSIQGALPPQLLAIHQDQGMSAFDTEDYIYQYRAIKQRFMNTQREFRKHRIPNPEESSSFGRWSRCANDILKRRATEKPEQPITAQNHEVAAPGAETRTYVSTQTIARVSRALSSEQRPGFATSTADHYENDSLIDLDLPVRKVSPAAVNSSGAPFDESLQISDALNLAVGSGVGNA